MAWTDITKRAIGKCFPKSVLDAVIDNLTWLKNAIGGASAVETIINGSFESDADADGIPDGYTWTASGGSIALESTSPGHGAKALKITSSGAGGGNVVHDDFILCSPNQRVILSFLHWSTVAGTADKVEMLWYDKAKAYISATTIYDDSATNPTSITRFVRQAAAPSTARYWRFRTTGANSATSGSSYFDYMMTHNSVSAAPLSWHIAEVTGGDTGWTDKATATVYVPIGATQFVARGQLKMTSSIYAVSCRFRIATTYSDEKSTTSASYVDVENTLDVSAYGGTVVTLALQCMTSNALSGYAYQNDNAGSIYTKRFI